MQQHRGRDSTIDYKDDLGHIVDGSRDGVTISRLPIPGFQYHDASKVLVREMLRTVRHLNDPITPPVSLEFVMSLRGVLTLLGTRRLQPRDSPGERKSFSICL